jgi:hypothetical protein
VRNSNRTGTVASVSVGNLGRTQVSVSVSTLSYNGYGVSCNGGTNGIITATGSGGTGTYQYSKDNSNWQTTPFTGLSAAGYSIYVKDSNNCTGTTVSATITQPTVLTSTISSSTTPTCYTSSDGAIGSTASGGVSPYVYYFYKNSVFVSSGSTHSWTGLTNGEYYVTVVDANGCSVTSSTTTLNRTAPNATFTKSNYNGYNISCNGGADGSIAVTGGSGGSGTGYSASTDNSTWYALPKTFYTLSAGSTYIFIKDSSGCYDGNGYIQTLLEPAALTATLTLNSTDTGSGGTVTASDSGGVNPKTYKIYQDNASPYNDYTTGPIFDTTTGVTLGSQVYNGLSAGYYWLQVTDANGCVAHSTGEVNTNNITYVDKLMIGTGLTCGSTSSLSNVYMTTADKTKYINNNNTLFVNMLIYSVAGGPTVFTNTRIFDQNNGTIYTINSNGYISAMYGEPC